MIKINEEFSAKKAVRGWELHHKTPAKSFNGKTPVNEFSTDTTYYPTFSMLGKAAINKSIGGCGRMEDILRAIALAEYEIIDAIEINKISE